MGWLSFMSADERETLRIAEARHQMKLKPIKVEQHLRELGRMRLVLDRIASGEERDPKLAAEVALGRKPIGALLAKPMVGANS